ncbi:hypothetical protein D5400_11800 [Georhizobium profundi]|uniref:Uncharacterized protein n=1 Tax=Georhizobium profundi TaxID=2341112 RepID=A0A3Q8XNU8_9HYPH|nr:hypothetical protein D5400_11800 [Georhizobium profundi]
MSKDGNSAQHDRGPAQPTDVDQSDPADRTMATEAAEHEVDMRKAKSKADGRHDNSLPSTTRTPPD